MKIKLGILSILLLLTGCYNNNNTSINNSINSSIFISSVNNNSNNIEAEQGYLMISIPQDQIYYQVNDNINLDNIEIYLINVNDYSKIKIDVKDVEVDIVDMSKAGEKVVNVRYKEYTGYFTIYVGTKLLTPQNITINSFENKVTWSIVEDVSMYQVRISDISREYGIFKLENNIFYYDKYNLVPGDYRFEVKSISNDINYYDSDYSEFINIHVKEEGELEPLNNPTGLRDNVTNFSWDSSSLVDKWIVVISNETYNDQFELKGNVNKIIYKEHEKFKSLESGTYNIKIKALPKDTTLYSESDWSFATFKILGEGEKVKLGTPFGLVDAGTYAMLGYLVNAKTFGVQIYSETNEFIKEVEISTLAFEYKRDLQIEEGIYNLYIYAKGYDVFLDSDLYGPCKINYKEVK